MSVLLTRVGGQEERRDEENRRRYTVKDALVGVDKGTRVRQSLTKLLFTATVGRARVSTTSLPLYLSWRGGAAAPSEFHPSAQEFQPLGCRCWVLREHLCSFGIQRGRRFLFICLFFLFFLHSKRPFCVLPLRKSRLSRAVSLHGFIATILHAVFMCLSTRATSF